MPFSLWFVCGFRTKNWQYYLSHLGIVFLIVGAIGSTGLSKEVFVLASPGSKTVAIAGMEIPVSALSEKDTLIKSLLQEDIVIECSKITSTSQGGILVPYVTKPLILLFWIGCFAVIVQPFIKMILKRFKKNKVII